MVEVVMESLAKVARLAEAWVLVVPPVAVVAAIVVATAAGEEALRGVPA
jgi:hypothetical protein